MEEQLMLREFSRGFLREDDSLCALLQGGFEEGDDVYRLARKFVCQLFAVGNQVGDINVAVVLSNQNILSYLVSVDVCAIDLKGEYEVF
jgi:hypothetical protein